MTFAGLELICLVFLYLQGLGLNPGPVPNGALSSVVLHQVKTLLKQQLHFTEVTWKLWFRTQESALWLVTSVNSVFYSC